MTCQLLASLIAAFLSATIPVSSINRHNTLANSDGLSNSSVTCITQDSTSVVWIGTWDGLNSYNGNRFVTYKYEHNNPNTISNNIIRNVAEEKDGVLWVATDYGINRIDTRTKNIERFFLGYENDSPTDEKVFSVTVAGGIVFCSAKGWGIAYFDSESKRMIALNAPKVNTSEILALHNGGDRTLVLHTSDNLIKSIGFERAENGGIRFVNNAETLPLRDVAAVNESGGKLFLSTRDGGIFQFKNNLESSAEVVCHLPVKSSVKALAQSSDGTLFIAADDGNTYSYSSKTEHFELIEALSDKNIITLFCGSEGILWAGSDGQGVIELYKNNVEFNRVTNQQMFDKKSAPVRAFYQDSDNNLFIGTKGNGIYVRSADGTGKTINSRHGLSNDFVYAMSEGFDNDLFIGHDGKGIDVLSLDNHKVQNIKPLNGETFGSIYCILKDPTNHCLWLGTNGYGLVRIETALTSDGCRIVGQRVFKNRKDDPKSLNNNSIFSIVPAGKDKLWIGTRGGGLNMFDKRSGEFIAYTASSDNNSISSNDILTLYMSRDSSLWIGTSYGLDRLSHNSDGSNRFKWYLEKDGLPNNTIHGILEDGNGNVWISTNRGLAKLNTTSQAIVKYCNDDELQNNEFSDGAAYCNSKGILFFGGIDGLNYFDPDDITIRDFEPTVLITDFFIKQQPLEKFNPSDKIVLNHDDNFFSIRFAALEFIDNKKCEYAYKLKGFNDDWFYSETAKEAIFTNVPPGNYTFDVRCTNGDKIWSGKTASMQILIKRPWWGTGWAYLIYFLLIAGMALAVWMVVRDHLEQRHKLEMESLSKKMQTDTYEAKLNFFTNVAHELITPLTLIFGSSELLLGRYDLQSSTAKQVGIINGNAGRMQRLIWELMEFRKIETGHTKPNYSFVNIKTLLVSIIGDFDELNENLNIRRKVSLPEGDTIIVSDRGALEKILYNLISNAYKYTPADGYIDIVLTSGNDGTSFVVTNSGKGISQENISRVFNRFEILDNFEHQARKGNVLRNGIGLALAQSVVKMLSGTINVASEVGKCTTFTVTLPVLGKDRVSGGIAQDNTFMPPSIPFEDRQEPDSVNRPQRSDAKRKIMIVDDEEQIRNLVADILNDEFIVIKASNGQEAFDILKQDRPDLIISDIIMPEIDGIELMKRLKSNEITKYIPLIFLTFKNEIENEIHGYEMGAEAYIPKPFHPNHLVAVIHQVLNSRSMLKDYFSSALSSTDVFNGQTVNAVDKEFMCSVIKIIEDGISDDSLSADTLSDKLLISRSQLYRKINEIGNMSPGELIRTIRLKYSAHLLKTSNLTVLEIMYQAGFNNKSYFYREFSKIYGKSPNKYRKED